MRKSKRILWELMTILEEAGEEDYCSLLNQAMGVQPYFGTGREIAEFENAIDRLTEMGEVELVRYSIQSGRTVREGEPIHRGNFDTAHALRFDPVAKLWIWNQEQRLSVELPMRSA
jgi:hypothetical protein